MKTKRKLNKPLLTKTRRARYFADPTEGSEVNTGNTNTNTGGTSSSKSAGDYVAGGLQALSGGAEIIANQMNRNKEMVQNIRDTRDQIISNTEATAKNDLNMMAASSSSLDDFANSAKTFSLADNVNLNYRDFLGSKGNAAMNIMGATMSGAGAGASAGGGWGALGGGIFGLLTGGIGWAKRKRKAKKETAEANRRINAVIDATNRQKLGAFSNAASNAEMNQESNEMLNFLSNNFSTGGGIHIKKANRGKFTESANKAGMGVQEYARHILANKDNYSSTLVKRANFARNAAKWHAEGGFLNSNGANFSNGLTYIDNGGTHEENPLEGVQIGMDSQGIPNLVEEGEVIYDDYVFTNRWKTPKNVKEALGIKKKSSITYADVAKDLSAESKERVNDPITKNTLERNLEILAQAQEADRVKREVRKARREFNNLPPEDQLGIMQNVQQYQQEQDMANMPMNNQFAEGGDIPPYSDEYSSDQAYQDYLLQKALMDSYYERTAGNALSESLSDKIEEANANKARRLKEANTRRIKRGEANKSRFERESEEAKVRAGLRKADITKSQREKREAAEDAEYRGINDEMTSMAINSIANVRERRLAENQAKFDEAVNKRKAEAATRKAKYDKEKSDKEERIVESVKAASDRMADTQGEAMRTNIERRADEVKSEKDRKTKYLSDQQAAIRENENRRVKNTTVNIGEPQLPQAGISENAKRVFDQGITKSKYGLNNKSDAIYREQLERELDQSSQNFYDRNISPAINRDLRERLSEREINDDLNLNRGFEVSPSTYLYDLRTHAPLIAEGDNTLFDNAYNYEGSRPSAWNSMGRLTAITSEAARNNALNQDRRQAAVEDALNRNIVNRVREKLDTMPISTPDSMPSSATQSVPPSYIASPEDRQYLFKRNKRTSRRELEDSQTSMSGNPDTLPYNAQPDRGLYVSAPSDWETLLSKPLEAPTTPIQPNTIKRDVVTPPLQANQDVPMSGYTTQPDVMPINQNTVMSIKDPNYLANLYDNLYNKNTPTYDPVADLNKTMQEAAKNVAARAAKPNNDVKGKKGKGKFGEKFKDLNLARYAPILGNLAATINNLMTKPDYSRANALKDEARRVGNWNPVTPNLISERAYYKPINPLEAMNTYMAQANASRKDLLNTAGGNKALAMSSLSSARNRDINALSKAQLDIENANLNRYNEVQRFNSGISQYNSEASLRAAMANEQARLNASNARAGLMDKAFAMQDAINNQRDAAISSSLSGLFEDIGNIGRERDARDMARFNIETGSFGNVPNDILYKTLRK